MLVISEKRLVPVQINTTILQDTEGRYYYMHRDLYDQLCVLWDSYNYGERTDILCKLLEHPIETWPDNVKYFYDTVPAPLKMAAPYLMLVQDIGQLDTLEDMCGALTVISMSINLRRFCKVDKSIRASITFSLHIREEYRTHWDRFFQENLEFEQFKAGVSIPKPQTTHDVPTSQGFIKVDNSTNEELEIQYTEPPMSEDDILASILGDIGVTDDDDDGDGVATGGGGSAGSAKPAVKVKSGFSTLKGV